MPLNWREGRRVKAGLRMARLGAVKTLDSFDVPFQPSLDRGRVQVPAQLGFVDRREVLHLLGPPGTGKSHLAVALGVEAVRAGRSVYFMTLADLVTALARAGRDGSLRERLRFLCRPQLLIVDEIGHLPATTSSSGCPSYPAAATCFSRLVNARYERGAMILTSHRGFGERDRAFGDPVAAAALLDRLLHHATVVQIEGSSYRMRQHASRVPDTTRAKPAAWPPAAHQAPWQGAKEQEQRSDQRLITAPNWGDLNRQP